MPRTVADQFVETLTAAGLRRIYGIVGDSLHGLTDAVRRHGKIDWVHVRHEEVAAIAAGAEAHLTGELAVCAGSCGPGNLHLINGLFDCHRSRVPVLAIATHIRPTSPELSALRPLGRGICCVGRSRPRRTSCSAWAAISAALVPGQIFFGHLTGDYVDDYQPAEFAAIEGRWHDEQPASEVLIAATAGA